MSNRGRHGNVQRTLAGSHKQMSPAQTTLLCACILASFGKPSVFSQPYSNKGLSPEAEACFNNMAQRQASLLANAGEAAERPFVNTLANLHGGCMSSFPGKAFDKSDLYVHLTSQYGLFGIPAKRISDAFAEIWPQHRQSETAVRERALAQELAKRSRSQEALAPVSAGSAQASSEVTFHWLLNRQLDLVNAWHRKVLQAAAQ